MSAQPVEDIDLMRRLLRNEASIAEIRAALTPEDAASLDAERRVGDDEPDRELRGRWARVALMTLQLGPDGHRRMLRKAEDRMRRAEQGERLPAWDWATDLRNRGIDG